MVPLVALHPYIGGGLLVEYFGHRRFDPARNALVLDSSNQLESPMTRDERLRYLSRLTELNESSSSTPPLSGGKANGGKTNEVKTSELKYWERLQASALPAIDTDGKPRIAGPRWR